MTTFFSRRVVLIGKHVLVHRTSISSNIILSIIAAKANIPTSHACQSRPSASDLTAYILNIGLLNIFVFS
jgi:hypothetical protein